MNGGGIAYNKYRPLSLLNTTFTDNIALYGPNLAGYPYGVRVVEYDKYPIASGQPYEGTITAEIVDVDGKRVTTD